MIVDRKTGKQVVAGDTLIRKDYKGFKHRFEVLEFLDNNTVQVRKLDHGDRWVYLRMPMTKLQLDEVMI